MKWMDNARVAAIFAVVMLHVAAYPVLNADFGSRQWWIANVYDAALRWCVPVFVMISGALLLEPKKEGLKDFYRKRASRVVLPLLFWSIFYLVWAKLKQSAYGYDPADISIWGRLSSGKPYFHLWFLYMIVFLYLFTPFLRMLIQVCKPRHLQWMVVCGFVLAALNTFVGQIQERQPPLFFNWFLLYIPYFFLGYIIRHSCLAIARKYVVSGLILSIGATAGGVYTLAKHLDLSVGTYFYDNLSVTVIPMSVCIILLLREWNRDIINQEITQNLSKLTLGVYLVHPVILDIAYFFDLNALKYNPLWSIPLLSALTYCLSLGLSYALHRTPLRHTL